MNDPITEELFRNAIVALGDEMALTIYRAAYSGVLKNIMDYSTAICDGQGRLVAQGHVRQIRDLIDKYPHHIVLICDDYRKLAARLVQWEDVEGVTVLAKGRGLMVETRSPDVFYGRLPALSLEEGTAIKEVYSDDDNLEAVFKYLVSK